MIKKKAKGKAKRSAKRRSTPKKQKELHPGEVRKDIARMVEASAQQIAQAVIEEGKKGQVPPAKYLFEFAGIFPTPPEGEQGTPEEDCLAKTLLHRLNLPEEPIDLENPPVLGEGQSAPVSAATVPVEGERNLTAEDAEKDLGG